MKALTTLRSVIDQAPIFGVTALIALFPVFFPGIALAAENQTQGQSAQIFEIKSSLSQTQINPGLSYDEVVKQDPQYQALKTYLTNHNSPLADYTDVLLKHDNWDKIVAISFVESNMCQHHYVYNCSGIGGQAYLRKYHNFGEWIDDMSNLLHQHYEGWSIDKMNGVYVQPKSRNWGIGANKILTELTELQAQTEAQTQATNQSVVALATFPPSSN